MLKLLSARSKRKKLASGSIARARSPQKSIQVRIARFFILLIGICLLLVGISFFIYRTVLNNALQLAEPRLLVLAPGSVDTKEKKLLVVHLAPQFQDSYVVSLDASQEVELPAGYGTYRLSAMYPLLKIDQRDSQFITASFSRALGMSIDNTYGLDSLQLTKAAFSKDILKIVTSETIRTQKLPLEAVKLWYFARQGLPVTEVSTVDELQKTLREKETTSVTFPECQVGVLNAGDQSGAAGALSTLFEKSGLVIIRTSSYPQQEPTTTIFHSGKEECARAVEVVSKAFVKRPVITKDEKITTQYRAPIVVIIGNDFQ